MHETADVVEIHGTTWVVNLCLLVGWRWCNCEEKEESVEKEANETGTSQLSWHTGLNAPRLGGGIKRNGNLQNR